MDSNIESEGGSYIYTRYRNRTIHFHLVHLPFRITHLSSPINRQDQISMMSSTSKTVTLMTFDVVQQIICHIDHNNYHNNTLTQPTR